MPEQDAELFEARIGIYARDEGVKLAIVGFSDLLRERYGESGWEISLVSASAPVEPDDMSIAEFYEDLPNQWRIENPGQTPTDYKIVEVRVGLVASPATSRDCVEALTLVLCPEPDHASACPIPWSAGRTEPTEGPDARTYLEQRYSHLRTSE